MKIVHLGIKGKKKVSYCFSSTSLFPLMPISSTWTLLKQRQKSTMTKWSIRFYRVCLFLTLAFIPGCQESLECQDFLQNRGHPSVKKKKKKSYISLTYSHANEYQGQFLLEPPEKKVLIFSHIIIIPTFYSNHNEKSNLLYSFEIKEFYVVWNIV